MIESTMAFRFRAGAGIFSTGAVSGNYYFSELSPFFYLILVWLLEINKPELSTAFFSATKRNITLCNLKLNFVWLIVVRLLCHVEFRRSSGSLCHLPPVISLRQLRCTSVLILFSIRCLIEKMLGNKVFIFHYLERFSWKNKLFVYFLDFLRTNMYVRINILRLQE